MRACESAEVAPKQVGLQATEIRAVRTPQHAEQHLPAVPSSVVALEARVFRETQALSSGGDVRGERGDGYGLRRAG